MWVEAVNNGGIKSIYIQTLTFLSRVVVSLSVQVAERWKVTFVGF